MTSPSVSVVIVSWNSKDDLPSCLGSLARQTERDFETIVVDNASSDGSVELVRRDFPWVRVIESGGNLGFAEGCNVGIEAAHGEWIATLNPDAEADPGWMAALRDAARAGDERLGMLQSRIVFRHAPDRTNSTGVHIFRNGSFVDRGFDLPLRRDEPGDEIFCPSAGAALYRRSMLEQLRLPSGIFDRRFFMYFEDVDLGWRARRAGFTARYVPEATVVHTFHGSAKRIAGSFVAKQCNRNRVRALVKNGSAGYVLRSAPRIFVEMLWNARHDGLGEIPAYAEAARTAIAERREVDRRARVRPCELERRWVEPRTPGSSSPRISVVIACYDYGRFLGEAIESALGQSLRPIEVVVVDDGSTDDSREVASRYPVRLVAQANAGVAAARNRGAHEAKGDLLVFLDADDALEPEYLARCWDALRNAPANVAYAYTQMRFFGDRDGIFASAPFSRRAVLGADKVNASAMIRREAFDAVGGFDPGFRLGLEDAELWIRLLDRGYIGTFVPEPLLRYRRHGPSRNALTERQLHDVRWRIRLSYPRLYWRDIARHPLEAARALARQRAPR